MAFNDQRYYSHISCGPDSLDAKLAVALTDVKASPGTATRYVLRCSLAQTDLAWAVERRYSEFLELRNELHQFFLHSDGGASSSCFGCSWFAKALHCFRFPRRHLLTSRSTSVISQRRVELHQFARLLAAHTFSAVPKCVSCVREVFPLVRAFFLRDACVPAHLSVKQLRRALRAKKFSAIQDPSKSKLEFRKERSVWKVLQIEEPVFTKISDLAMHQRKCRAKRRHARRPTATSRREGSRRTTRTASSDTNDEVRSQAVEL